MLIPLRPSSEHILIVRAPGAKDQPGCHSSPTLCEQEGHLSAPFPSSQAHSVSLQGWGLIDLPLRAWYEHSFIVRVLRAQKIIRPHPFLCSVGAGLSWVSVRVLTVIDTY